MVITTASKDCPLSESTFKEIAPELSNVTKSVKPSAKPSSVIDVLKCSTTESEYPDVTKDIARRVFVPLDD
jgi:hypothetical protein